MLFNVDSSFVALRDQIARAQAVSPELISNFVAHARARLTKPGCAAGKASRICRLIEAQAWTEAALALLALELPQWTLRRIAYEDGVWHCRLTLQWNLPDWLADSVDARHECMPLAILSAMMEAAECCESVSRRPAGSVPRLPAQANSRGEMVCCDNFA